MALEIMRDPRVRSVEWRDLVALKRFEVIRELLLPWPWLAGWLGCAVAISEWGHYGIEYYAWAIPGLACSFMFFLAGLRVVHNAFHGAVGVKKFGDDLILLVLSIVMCSAMHAVKVNHLRHHTHCMDDEDHEAASAKMKGWQAILFGPFFFARLHTMGLVHGNGKHRRWIVVEFLAIGAVIGVALALPELTWLRWHCAVMLVGQCGTAFFAVWTVHHDCDRDHFIARTIRNPFKVFVTMNMFYHVEHHLYPRVPTCHLPELSKRLDEKAPELKHVLVF